MNTYRGRLIDALKDEDYRYAYDEEFANSRMATQIKVIREQREEMTQARLAEKAGMRQSRISALENVDYSAWSISTLRRLARALGVRLTFKFESWGELLSEVEEFSREALQRPDFEHDRAFQENEMTIAANPELGAFKEQRSANNLIQEMARLGDHNYGIIGSKNR
jgi:transcriptional regulator with XRE-family HTH domain